MYIALQICKEGFFFNPYGNQRCSEFARKEEVIKTKRCSNAFIQVHSI